MINRSNSNFPLLEQIFIVPKVIRLYMFLILSYLASFYTLKKTKKNITIFVWKFTFLLP